MSIFRFVQRRVRDRLSNPSPAERARRQEPTIAEIAATAARGLPATSQPGGEFQPRVLLALVPVRALRRHRWDHRGTVAEKRTPNERTNYRPLITYEWLDTFLCGPPPTRHRWRLTRAQGTTDPPQDATGTWGDLRFAVPDGAIILGIEIEVRANAVQANYGPIEGDCGDTTQYTITAPRTGVVHLLHPVQGQSAAEAIPAQDGTFVLGGPTSLWGLSWTPAHINAATFRVRPTLQAYWFTPFKDLALTIFTTDEPPGSPPVEITYHQSSFDVLSVTVYWQV